MVVAVGSNLSLVFFRFHMVVVRALLCFPLCFHHVLAKGSVLCRISKYDGEGQEESKPFF